MNVVTALGQDEKLRMVAVSLWAAFASALLSVSARLFERSFDARVLWMLAGFALALLLVRRAATWRLEVGSFCLCVLLWAVFTCGVLMGGVDALVAVAFMVVIVLIASLLLGTRASLLFGVASAAAGSIAAILDGPDRLQKTLLVAAPVSDWMTFALALGWAAVVIHFYNRYVQRMASALRYSEELMRSAMESSPDYVMRVDRDARLVFINRTVAGLTVEQVLGTSIHDRGA